MNSAAVELAPLNPDLLQRRKELHESARAKVNERYKFKKGKSRSKRSQNYSDDDTPKPKQQKTTERIRKQHIANLEEDIKDLRDRLQFKEKRRSRAKVL